MKPCPDQPDDTKPRYNAHSGSALRTGVRRIYLPPPLDAQAWAEMQTWLSPRLQSDPLGALYGYAMEMPARAAGRRWDRHDPLHNDLQGVRPMVRRWLTRSGLHRQRAPSGRARPSRPQHLAQRWLQHRRQEGGDGIGYSGHKHQK